MANLDQALFGEGQSITRPPMFNGTNYSSWKARMKIFLKSINMRLWFIVKNGPYVAQTIENGKMRDKNEDELTELELTKLSLNAKAMNVLFSSLNANETTRVKGCLTCKEIWDTLMQVHEGSNDMKEQKKSLLVTRYETFMMLQNETIDAMFCRFNETWKHLIKVTP